jgi:hypothetical protein
VNPPKRRVFFFYACFLVLAVRSGLGRVRIHDLGLTRLNWLSGLPLLLLLKLLLLSLQFLQKLFWGLGRLALILLLVALIFRIFCVVIGSVSGIVVGARIRIGVLRLSGSPGRSW